MLYKIYKFTTSTKIYILSGSRFGLNSNGRHLEHLDKILGAMLEVTLSKIQGEMLGIDSGIILGSSWYHPGFIMVSSWVHHGFHS